MRRLDAAVAVAIAGLSVVSAAAQTRPAVVPAILIAPMPEAIAVRRPIPQTAVVDRLFFFDADGDDRVTSDELPERMRHVMDRVDRNEDRFITADEIEAALVRSPAVVGGRTFTLRSRSPSGLAEVIQDLKLPPPTHDRAIAIVKSYRVPRNVNDANSVDLPALHAAMRELLDDEDYENFIAAAARLGVRGIDVGVVADRLRESIRQRAPDNQPLVP